MNKIFLVIYLTSLLFFEGFGQVYTGDQYPENYKVEWEQMNQSKQETVDWFKEAKYGMFIHWGLYAIPAGVWKGKKIHEMRQPHVAEWIMHAAEIPRKEYAELAKEFNPVNFDANEIAQLAKDAGMKYVVITAKHHDGFAMFDSKVSEYDVIDATPFKRDIIKELLEACKKLDLAFGIYYSHNIDWYDGSDSQSEISGFKNPGIDEHEKTFGANLWDTSPNNYENYLKNKAYPQVIELMNNYPDLKLLWYDMPWRMSPEQCFRFYKIVYDIQPQILINERIGHGFGDYNIPGDNTIPVEYEHLQKPWETVGTFNNSWGYNSYDNDWKTPEEVLYWLVEIVSKGGNYMLNIGPKASGEIPLASEQSLKAIGKWLSVNGEAIYGTFRWKISHEGPSEINFTSTEDRAEKGFRNVFTPLDFWFTQKGNSVFAISLVKPEKRIVIKSFNNSIGKITGVELLGSGRVDFKQTEEALIIQTPKRCQNNNGFVLKINLNQ